MEFGKDKMAIIFGGILILIGLLLYTDIRIKISMNVLRAQGLTTDSTRDFGEFNLAAFKTVDRILNESKFQWNITTRKFNGGTPKLSIQSTTTKKYYVLKICEKSMLFRVYKEIAAAALKAVMFGRNALNAKGSLILMNNTLESTAAKGLKTHGHGNKNLITTWHGARILEGVRVDMEPDIVELRREGCGVFRRNETVTFTSWLLDMMVNNGDRDCRSNIFYSDSKNAFLLLDFDGGPPISFVKGFCCPKEIYILEHPPFYDKRVPNNFDFYCDALNLTRDLLSTKFPPLETARKQLYEIFLDDEWIRFRSTRLPDKPSLGNWSIAHLRKALGLLVGPHCVSKFAASQTQKTRLLPAFLADVYARRVHHLKMALEKKYKASCQARPAEG